MTTHHTTSVLHTPRKRSTAPKFTRARAAHSLVHTDVVAVSAPITGSVAEMVRRAQLSLGGWGCDLLELRKANRLLPRWCCDGTSFSLWSESDCD